jgi:lysophospholipase L1-like esterase
MAPESIGSSERSEEQRPGEGARRGYPFLSKLALALLSFLFVAGGLELAARLMTPPHTAPRQMREGYFATVLPLSTGLVNPRFRHDKVLEERLELPYEKRDGEIRIFVFGESSVAGTPYGVPASAPAMLTDQLRRDHPGKDLVVVNMGVPGSIITNTYYQLVDVARYDPDVLIFYLGINDVSELPGEWCAAAQRPVLHALWRGLVERLMLPWAARVLGPPVLWRTMGRSGGLTRAPEKCEMPFEESFGLWTDIVLKMAAGMADKVVVTTPVRSELYVLEPKNLPESGQDHFASMEEGYREILACQLSEVCDFEGAFAELVRDAGEQVDKEMAELESYHRKLHATWKEAADRHGADLVDFRASLAGVSPGGRLIQRHFSDEVHLDLAGYYLLASHWAERLKPFLGESKPGEPALPSAAELAPHRKAISGDPNAMLRSYLRRGWFLTSVPGLRDIASDCSGRACEHQEEARTALSWLCWKAGVVPAPVGDEMARIESFVAELTAGDR